MHKFVINHLLSTNGLNPSIIYNLLRYNQTKFRNFIKQTLSKMLTKSLLPLFCIVSLSAASNNITTYTYKTLGDLNILLDVYTPPSPAPSTGYPMLLAIHGGAYCFGDKTGAFTDQELTEIMNRGWVIVSIDYRLFPGAFLQDIIEDIQGAYPWVLTRLPSYTPVNTGLIQSLDNQQVAVWLF